MKNKLTQILIVVLLQSLSLALMSCEGTPKKEPVFENQPDTPRVSSGMVTNSINSKMDKIPVMGFFPFKKKFQ